MDEEFKVNCKPCDFPTKKMAHFFSKKFHTDDKAFKFSPAKAIQILANVLSIIHLGKTMSQNTKGGMPFFLSFFSWTVTDYLEASHDTLVHGPI